jgi:DtxR family Mn-dependent transcriptional regulator
VMSDSVEAALNALLGAPTTCPHGNPIPGSEYVASPVRRLVDVPDGASFTVTRIPEELEFAPGMLEFLERSAITPGTSGHVAASAADGSVLVDIGGQRVDVDEFASKRILVAG